MHRLPNGEVWDAFAGIVPRVFGTTAKAKMHQGINRTVNDRECGGRAPTRKALRCTRSLPQVHEDAYQPFQSSGENRGLEVLAKQRSLVGARDSSLHG